LAPYVGLKQALANNDFRSLAFKAIADSLIDKRQKDPTLARMDRARFLSDTRNLSRCGVFVRAIEGFMERGG
jgi:hypothetical protein